jgi:hypothetical protein
LIDMTVGLTHSRALTLRQTTLDLARAARQQVTWPVRRLALVIDRLSATRLQHQQASLHLCRLNNLKTGAVRASGWNGTVRLSPSILPDTDWWLQQLV